MGDFTTRESRNKFYTSRQWKEMRQEVLNRNPLCVVCLVDGSLTPATEIDHIKPLRLWPGLCLEISNLQGLCHKHHGEKTLTEYNFVPSWKIYKSKWVVPQKKPNI